MRNRILSLFASIIILSIAAGELRAEAPAKPSGTEKGAIIPGSFQCWMVTGKHAGRYHSPVCEHGLNPVVLIFARPAEKSDKLLAEPLVKFLKTLDEMIAKHPDARLGCCVIVLNDGGYRDALESEAKEGEDFSKKLAATAKIKDKLEANLKELAKATGINHVTIALDRVTGPKDYKINDAAQVTVLFYNRHMVLGRQEFQIEFKDEDADKTAAEVQKTVLDVERSARPRKK